MKQYLAFYGDCCYPSGGIDDFIGDYDTKKEAIEKAHLKIHGTDDKVWEWDWGDVWDSKDRIKVYTK